MNKNFLLILSCLFGLASTVHSSVQEVNDIVASVTSKRAQANAFALAGGLLSQGIDSQEVSKFISDIVGIIGSEQPQKNAFACVGYIVNRGGGFDDARSFLTRISQKMRSEKDLEGALYFAYLAFKNGDSLKSISDGVIFVADSLQVPGELFTAFCFLGEYSKEHAGIADAIELLKKVRLVSHQLGKGVYWSLFTFLYNGIRLEIKMEELLDFLQNTVGRYPRESYPNFFSFIGALIVNNKTLKEIYLYLDLLEKVTKSKDAYTNIFYTAFICIGNGISSDVVVPFLHAVAKEISDVRLHYNGFAFAGISCMNRDSFDSIITSLRRILKSETKTDDDSYKNILYFAMRAREKGYAVQVILSFIARLIRAVSQKQAHANVFALAAVLIEQGKSFDDISDSVGQILSVVENPEAHNNAFYCALAGFYESGSIQEALAAVRKSSHERAGSQANESSNEIQEGTLISYLWSLVRGVISWLRSLFAAPSGAVK